MLRSKWILFMMIIMPLITIGLLSNAFKSMLTTSFEINEFKVGYRTNTGSLYEPMMSKLQDSCKEQGILLQEYPEGDIKELLLNRTVAVFVDIQSDNFYKLYRSDEKKIEAAMTDSIFSGFFYQVNEAVTVKTYSVQNKINPSTEQWESKLIQEKLPTDPVPSSTDYYGIIYIVYFAWCGLVSLVAVISSERKSAILRRMRITQMSNLNQYLGKFIPCTLAIFLEVCASWILSVLLYDIHWGNIGISIFIIALISMATSAFGIILFQLFHNVAIGIVIGFIITWICGYFGGSFQSYMYLDIPKFLINASPIYYINRTLVEFSTVGHSDYAGICIGYLLAIIFSSGLIGILLIRRKMEE